MLWTKEKIRIALGDKLVGNVYMREKVCQTLLKLPGNIIENVCKTIWFVSSPEDAWALTFRGADIKARHLIFLSDELFTQDGEQIAYTILHEVGHAILNHRNSVGYMQTEREIKEQEREADIFAKKYLNS